MPYRLYLLPARFAMEPPVQEEMGSRGRNLRIVLTESCFLWIPRTVLPDRLRVPADLQRCYEEEAPDEDARLEENSAASFASTTTAPRHDAPRACP